MKLSEGEISCVKKAIENLQIGFVWSSSDEGNDYWRAVVDRLKGYVKSNRQGAECRAEIEALKRRLAELESRCA